LGGAPPLAPPLLLSAVCESEASEMTDPSARFSMSLRVLGDSSPFDCIGSLSTSTRIPPLFLRPPSTFQNPWKKAKKSFFFFLFF
jgi:hypothetical protein